MHFLLLVADFCYGLRVAGYAVTNRSLPGPDLLLRIVIIHSNSLNIPLLYFSIHAVAPGRAEIKI